MTKRITEVNKESAVKTMLFIENAHEIFLFSSAAF
jgi:hypothetical protein